MRRALSRVSRLAAAHGDGLGVLRRPDASPACALGVVVVAKAKAAQAAAGRGCAWRVILSALASVVFWSTRRRGQRLPSRKKTRLAERGCRKVVRAGIRRGRKLASEIEGIKPTSGLNSSLGDGLRVLLLQSPGEPINLFARWRSSLGALRASARLGCQKERRSRRARLTGPCVPMWPDSPGATSVSSIIGPRPAPPPRLT